MTDLEVRDAAGMIIERGKITKLKGDLLEISGASACTDHMEVTMTIRLDGDVYDLRDDYSYSEADTRTATMCRGVELYGPDGKCFSDDHYAKIVAAERAVEKWALPGVKDLGDIKKAPREITKTMMNAVCKIMTNPKLSWIMKGYTREMDIIVSDREFAIAMAYDALRFGPEDVEDTMTQHTLAALMESKPMLTPELKGAIDNLEKEAVANG